MPETGAAPVATGSEGTQTQATEGGNRPGYLAHVKDNGLKSDSAIGTFLSQKAPDLDSLVRGYHELSTKSANMVEIPGQDAKPEAVEAFWRKMGKPDSPDKYELPRLEGDFAELHDDARDKWFRNVAHSLHLPAGVAKTIVHEHNEQIKREFMAIREAESQAQKAAEAALKTEWGKDYEANYNMASAAMNVLSEGNDEIISALNSKTSSGTRLGDHPALVKLFQRVALSLTEASVEAGGMGSKEQGKKDDSGHYMLEYPSMVKG